MWFLYFVNAFQSSILNNLTPYVTSDFESHSLLTVIYIVSSCMSAASYIPISKILDLWGRAEGFVIMVGFATLGLILMASCHSLGTFCAAQVRYKQHRCKEFTNFIGFLFHWIRRYDLQRGRHHSRRDKIEKPRIGVCLYLFAVYDNSVCWS